MLDIPASASAVSTKKGKTGKTDHRDCTAGIALTAEFVLDGVSELTRSIFVYLGKLLNLTDDVCPALIGAALDEFADLLTRERRIQANLALLRWSFLCMVEMIKKRIELPSSNEHALYEKFRETIHCSVRKQVEEFACF